MTAALEYTQEDYDVALGFRLKMLRQARGLSQEEIGQALGTSYQQIQKYEAGKSKMPAHRLALCAKALNVSPDYLLFGDLGLADNISYDKKIMNIAGAIAQLSDLEAKQIYQLALTLKERG